MCGVPASKGGSTRPLNPDSASTCSNSASGLQESHTPLFNPNPPRTRVGMVRIHSVAFVVPHGKVFLSQLDLSRRPGTVSSWGNGPLKGRGEEGEPLKGESLTYSSSFEPQFYLPSEYRALSKYFLTLINYFGLRSGSLSSKWILLGCILMMLWTEVTYLDSFSV